MSLFCVIKHRQSGAFVVDYRDGMFITVNDEGRTTEDIQDAAVFGESRMKFIRGTGQGLSLDNHFIEIPVVIDSLGFVNLANPVQ